MHRLLVATVGVGIAITISVVAWAQTELQKKATEDIHACEAAVGAPLGQMNADQTEQWRACMRGRGHSVTAADPGRRAASDECVTKTGTRVITQKSGLVAIEKTEAYMAYVSCMAEKGYSVSLPK